MRAIILDTETTTNKGTPERPLEVIELAVLYDDKQLVQRFKPTRPPAWGALAVHGILMTELEGCPPASEAPRHVPAAEYWIGHNIDFDWTALGSPPGVKRICTLALSRFLWPELDSHTLSAMMYFTLGATPETRERLRSAHNALADCMFVVELTAAIERVAKVEGLEALYALSEDARVPRTMTFGKFVGQPVSAVDAGYAAWYARQSDPDPYLLEAFYREGKLRRGR